MGSTFKLNYPKDFLEDLRTQSLAEVVQRAEFLQSWAQRLSERAANPKWTVYHLNELAYISGRLAAAVDAQKAKVRRIDAERVNAVRSAETLQRVCDNLGVEVARLQSALEFYAKPETWDVNGHPQIDADTKPIVRDGGKVARNALAGGA